MCPAQHSITTEDAEKNTRGIINSLFQRAISTNEVRGRDCSEEEHFVQSQRGVQSNMCPGNSEYHPPAGSA